MALNPTAQATVTELVPEALVRATRIADIRPEKIRANVNSLDEVRRSIQVIDQVFQTKLAPLMGYPLRNVTFENAHLDVSKGAADRGQPIKLDADGTIDASMINLADVGHAILDGSIHTDSVADGVTRGSIIYGNATPKWDELVLGASGRVLRSDGTDMSWAVLASSDLSDSANILLADGSVALTAPWAANNDITGLTKLEVDNVRIDGNTVSVTNANDDLILVSNGTGQVTIKGGPSIQGQIVLWSNNIRLVAAIDTDVLLSFAGSTNQGSLTYMEDEDEFRFSAPVIATGLAIDTAVFFVDAANDYIGVGSATPNTDNQMHFLMNASKDILIDGTTNQRMIATGVIRFEQTPAITNTRCITCNVDANSQVNTHAMVVNMVATQITAGETISCYDVNVDSANSDGGIVRGFEMSIAGSGGVEAHLIHADPGVVLLSQLSGSFINVEQAFKYTGSYTDITAAFNDAGTDVEIFTTNGHIVYVGMAATFDQLEVILATVASGPGVKPTFEFSEGAGSWDFFTPIDETQGFRQAGLINWTISDLATWAVDTVNAVSNKYWIRITRTQVSLSTPPIEDTIQVSKTTLYKWDENGDVTCNTLDSGVATGTAPLVVASTTVVANLNCSFLEGNAASAFMQDLIDDTTPQLGGNLDANDKTIFGSAASGGDLTLGSTSHATKGKLLLGAAGASVYDEVNDRLGLGQATPAARLHVEETGTAKANLDIMQIVNAVSAADMDETGTSILFRQFYFFDPTPAVADMGRLKFNTTTDWQPTASTRDGEFIVEVALDGTLIERLSLTGNNTGFDGFTLRNTKLWVYAENSNAFINCIAHDIATGSGGRFVMRRTRGTQDTPLAVQSGDNVGTLEWRAPDTNDDYKLRAQVVCSVDGAVTGTGVVPMAIAFATKNTNANPVDRLTIDSSGDVTLNTAGVRLQIGDEADNFIEDFGSGRLKYSTRSVNSVSGHQFFVSGEELRITATAAQFAHSVFIGSASTTPDAILDVDGDIALKDGMTAPTQTAGKAKLFVDTADGDLKIIFGDGTIKTIVVDT